MVALLEKLREVVQSTKKQSAVVAWTKVEGLRVFESTSNRQALPDDVVQRFWVENHRDDL
jgi:hypothetical protein